MKDITTIVTFYQDKKRIAILVIFFILLVITLLAVDLINNPYPPKISFVEDGQLLKGEIYLNDEYIGTMETTVFSNLPDDFCEKPYTLSLDTETESFSWEVNPGHCKANYVKLEVNRRTEKDLSESQSSQTSQ